LPGGKSAPKGCAHLQCLSTDRFAAIHRCLRHAAVGVSLLFAERPAPLCYHPPTDREPLMNAPDPTADALLDIVRELGSELHPARRPRITLDSALDRDVGLDSLARVELLLRLERRFGVALPEGTLINAETPRDLLNAVLNARMPESPQALAERIQSAPSAATVPEQARTLVEALDAHLHAQPERIHITLIDESGTAQEITYAALHAGAMRIAAGLLERNLPPRATVAIMLPTGAEYFFSFFGILLAGGIPVPIYPPARPSQIEDHMRRHGGILANAQARMLITVPEAKALALLLRSQVASLADILTPAEFNTGAAGRIRPTARPDDIAFLQYTSGSTGNPKGVVLTHAHVLANLNAMGRAIGVESTDVFVSWLPLYHDMGLIGAWLGSLYYGFRLVVMSPLTFLARPHSWLRAIHRYRGTLSAAPNFAYQLCARRIDERDLEGLDLSTWRLAFNGAEPVSPDTLEEFAARFEKRGLRRTALTPVYGLAECSVGLAFPPLGRGPRIDRIERATFINSGRAQPVSTPDADVLRIVACGHPLPGHQIRIVDGAGREVPERYEGRLQFTGPSATQGYYRNPEETRRLFDGAWLDSGDYAYIAEGDIYLTGRAKDLIIRAGRNIFPYELEESVGNIPGIRKGCVAVVGSVDPQTNVERVVVLAETREKDVDVRDKLKRQINDIAFELIGMAPDDIVLVPPHTVLKTSSGKIRRAACRELYERGGRSALERAVWWQLARLAMSAVMPQIRRALARAAEFAYGLYIWICFALLAPLTWLASVLSRTPRASWRVSRAGARALFRLSGTRLTVQGLEHVPPPGSRYVLVANHASYLDGIVLVAALPELLRFVAKRELENYFVTRSYLRSIGTQFVERFDLQRGLADTERLLELIHSGQALGFFPEGTFRRMPGLLPFRMGAFVVAAQAGAPVVPLALRGTRSILREGHWLPRRGALHVTVSAPIAPQGDDWDAAIALRDAARLEILHNVREPDLALETLESKAAQ
jgi:1-acyl-sn-glycerol-3-phosphate acyltransferase